MTLLDVRGLTVRTADGRTLVDDLSFTVGSGERLGLIGESGSGKSLTTLAILGLLPTGMTASGSVELAGTQIVGAPEKRLTAVRGRDAAVVFQEPLTALDPLMRVGRQIAGPLARRTGLRGPALRSAVLDGLEQVRLPDPERVARAFPHEISGGQRQRVALAMALACAPALLIADEPTTALDVSVQAEILTLLDTLVAEREMAVLFVSHDLAVVARVTDRALVLKDGRCVEEGPVLDVVGAPRAPYTKTLVDGARTLQAALDLRSSR
ncbi:MULTISPECIES: ABC transporter ATP-binding protein [Streptomyces]|uniref:ABC transporter ATP-binding protein n=1 Tax=Streptomyces doudnae TaxID=3075536 RepID=A0ABD5F1X8_9ACTN|nr:MULTISPECIES: ABC transporter ATP-binding protein [unclassified Streptomyces]MDT0440508.1 ABC transporter ATP-binding protein [Streptomyces sp. DSM 41981]MYQ64857.1 ATP-binding cassette domain-containing protein [Streptomyces sp. SID4950]SCD87698.1 peptide/nickel transport system ATP-binding protein [Streptomyces sp. SolWspMP-5a-2]